MLVRGKCACLVLDLESSTSVVIVVISYIVHSDELGALLGFELNFIPLVVSNLDLYSRASH